MPEATVLGTVPQWALLAAVVLGLFKLIPAIRAQSLESKQQDIEGWREEAHSLRAKLEECEEDCDRRLKKLEAELWGEKRQRVAEQISLVNVIIESVNAPELKAMLRTLESVQSHLMLSERVEGMEGGK